MSSIVADELAKIKSFETDTEKRRSELTLNELNYISDKQLHKKGGGGSGDSLVKAADVRFTTDDTIYSGTLDNVFPEAEVSIYVPGRENIPAIVSVTSLNETIAVWNTAMMDGRVRVVAPQGFLISDGDFNVSVVSGSAEILELAAEVSVLYITGDCEISVITRQ